MSSDKGNSTVEKAVKEESEATTKKEEADKSTNDAEEENDDSDDAVNKNDSGGKEPEKKVKEEDGCGNDGKKEASVRRKRGAIDLVVDLDDRSPVGKRRRKTASTAAYKPDDFSEKKAKVATKGRGDRLRDIPSTKASIESYKLNSEALRESYRFLFPGRGKILPAMRTQLLDFSGYVPDIDDDVDEETAKRIAKEEEIMEEKYAKKAYKLTIPQLQTMCEFFDVDRSPAPGEKVGKDVLVERLLDFLSAPTEEETHAYIKKNKITRKPIENLSSSNAEENEGEEVSGDDDEKENDTNEEEEEEEEDDDDDDNANETSKAELQGKLGALPKSHQFKMPSDDVLRTWVRAFVACHNMSTATLRNAIEIATSKFGVDMKDKKETLKMLITEEC